MMNSKIFLEIFLVVLFVGISISLYYLLSNANKLFRELDDLEKRAKVATTRLELEALWLELKHISKQSWHRSIGARVNEVKIIIETRYEFLR